MKAAEKPVARKDDIVVQEIDGEVLIYDLKESKALCLNQTSALVWRECDGKKNTLEIAKSLENRLGATIKEELVWLAIDQLSKEKLLEKEIVTEISGLSRREVVKRIGLASMVALPIVGMLSFPQSSLGQSQSCPPPICSNAAGSGGCPGTQHCCRGTCQPQSTACSPACAT